MKHTCSLERLIANLWRVEYDVQLAHILENLVQRLHEHLYEVQEAQLRLRGVTYGYEIESCEATIHQLRTGTWEAFEGGVPATGRKQRAAFGADVRRNLSWGAVTRARPPCRRAPSGAHRTKHWHAWQLSRRRART